MPRAASGRAASWAESDPSCSPSGSWFSRCCTSRRSRSGRGRRCACRAPPRAGSRCSGSGSLGSGLAFLLFFRLLGRWGATRTSLVAYLIPVFGLAAGSRRAGGAGGCAAAAGHGTRRGRHRARQHPADRAGRAASDDEQRCVFDVGSTRASPGVGARGPDAVRCRGDRPATGPTPPPDPLPTWQGSHARIPTGRGPVHRRVRGADGRIGERPGPLVRSRGRIVEPCRRVPHPGRFHARARDPAVDARGLPAGAARPGLAAAPDGYVDPAMNGIDWDAVHSDFEQRMLDTLDAREAYQIVSDMVGLLEDPDTRLRLGARPRIERHRPDLRRHRHPRRLDRRPDPATGLRVLYVFPGSPALAAGIAPRDVILAVDGDPCPTPGARAGTGRHRRQPARPVARRGAADRRGRARSASRRRTRRPRRVPDEPRIGYLRLLSLAGDAAGPGEHRALTGLLDDGDLAGLVLDLRHASQGSRGHDRRPGPVRGRRCRDPHAHDGDVPYVVEAGALRDRLQDVAGRGPRGRRPRTGRRNVSPPSCRPRGAPSSSASPRRVIPQILHPAAAARWLGAPDGRWRADDLGRYPAGGTRRDPGYRDEDDWLTSRRTRTPGSTPRSARFVGSNQRQRSTGVIAMTRRDAIRRRVRPRGRALGPAAAPGGDASAAGPVAVAAPRTAPAPRRPPRSRRLDPAAAAGGASALRGRPSRPTGCCSWSCARTCPPPRGGGGLPRPWSSSRSRRTRSGLGVIVSRVREAAPAYLDWRDHQFAVPGRGRTTPTSRVARQPSTRVDAPSRRHPAHGRQPDRHHHRCRG